MTVCSTSAALKRAKDEMMKGGQIFEALLKEKDERWQEHYSLVKQARGEKLTSHGLFAAVVMRSPIVSKGIPHPLCELMR